MLTVNTYKTQKHFGLLCERLQLFHCSCLMELSNLTDLTDRAILVTGLLEALYRTQFCFI